MANPYQDIDEGFDTFDEDEKRRAAEARFFTQAKKTPIVFKMLGGCQVESRRIQVIHLFGQLKRPMVEASHPYHYEEGYCEMLATFRCPDTPAQNLKVTLRWRDYGDLPILTVNP